MTRLLLLMGCLIGPSCALQAAPPDVGHVVASSLDEQAERDAILVKVRTAIASEDFAALSAMEDDFGSTRARTPSGIWKLAVFHAGLQAYLAEGLQRDNGCQYRQAPFVQRWGAAVPGNSAPVITDAALLLDQAWCFRGNGYSDSVATEDWPKFQKGVAAASEVLAKHKTTASADPEYYAIEVKVLRAQGVSKSVFQAVVNEAIAREPYYHRTYFNAVWYYLPQWGGSNAEVEGFARYAAARTHAGESGGLYARLFWSLEECGCRIIEQAADWPTMKQAMRDVYDRYPTPWNGEYNAQLSCRMGDSQEGHRYFKAIHPEAIDDSSFAALFASCDNQARAER